MVDTRHPGGNELHNEIVPCPKRENSRKDAEPAGSEWNPGTMYQLLQKNNRAISEMVLEMDGLATPVIQDKYDCVTRLVR